MLRYLAKRLAFSLLILLGSTVITFGLVRLVPGDTVTVLLGAQYDEEQAAVLRAKYGLDRPLPVQYFTWLGTVLTGDFGHSAYARRPVRELLLEHLPVTLELAGLALLLAALVGVPMGVVAAVGRHPFVDKAVSGLGLLGVSIPGFWLGTMLVLLFAQRLGWLPTGGYTSPLADPLANLRAMLLPALALGAAVAAVMMRMSRAAVLEVMNQDYVRTARAKGLARERVVIGHILRNALVPIVTVFGIQTGYLLGGSVVIERVFSLPGVGMLALRAIAGRDYQLLQGTLLFIAAGFIAVNLAVDLICGWINPRLRMGAGS